MTEPKTEGALLVGQSPRRQLPRVGMIAAILCVYVLLGAFSVVKSAGVVCDGDRVISCSVRR